MSLSSHVAGSTRRRVIRMCEIPCPRETRYATAAINTAARRTERRRCGGKQPKTIGGTYSINHGAQEILKMRVETHRSKAPPTRKGDGLWLSPLRRQASRNCRSRVGWRRGTRSRTAQAHCSPKYWATFRKFLPPYKYTGCEESERGARTLAFACGRWC